MTKSSRETIRERVISFFAQYPEETFKPMVLAHRLSMKSDEEIKSLRTLLNELEQDGLIARSAGRRYGHTVAPVSSRVTGVFTSAKQGHGIVETAADAGGEKIYISPRFRSTALDGDTVSVAVFARPVEPGSGDMDMPEGEVVAVVSRATRIFVGTFQKGENFSFAVPDSRRIGRDIYIPQGKSAGARPGDKVSVRIFGWEDAHLNPEGEVVAVLGKAGEVKAEMISIREEFQLPDAFPAAVLTETGKIPGDIPAAEIKNRLDLRDLVCFTIDPETAKDHDDALSIRDAGKGLTEVGVHIADVSHYVREGSPLDVEARTRGTSVYLPGSVIPMLPERLSGDLCSLMPEVDRLAYSVLLFLTPEGIVKDYQIRKTVIHSRMKFSYEHAQEVLDSGGGPYLKELRALLALSRKVLDARMLAGSIDFDSTEVGFEFDRHGLPSAIVKKERLASHRLIEEFMLLANQTVAGHIGRTRKGSATRPFIYRIHDNPEPGKLLDFSTFVQHLGYSFPVKTGVTSRAFQKLMSAVKGKEEEKVVNELAIRSMAKACYSDANIGHFGLAFKYYSHFTSPIRRYPDLVVHRLLHEYDDPRNNPDISRLNKLLPDICAESSARERVAVSAERAGIKVMQVEYMKRHVGDVFPALVSGVMNFGLFVEITDLLVEGLIRVRDLENDFYVYDEKHYQLVGRRTKHRYRLGDKLTVRVVRVDPEDRQIDFKIVEEDQEVNSREGRGEIRGAKSADSRSSRGGDGRSSRGGDGRGSKRRDGGGSKRRDGGGSKRRDGRGSRRGKRKS